MSTFERSATSNNNTMKERENIETQNETGPCLSPDNLLRLSRPPQTTFLGTGTFNCNDSASSSVHFAPSSVFSSAMRLVDKTDDNSNGKSIFLKSWMNDSGTI